MKPTIEARIYFEPDQPGRLYMKRAYPYIIPPIKDWCPSDIRGEARTALWKALDAIGAKSQTADGIKEMIYKMELNSHYPLYGRSKFQIIVPGI